MTRPADNRPSYRWPILLLLAFLGLLWVPAYNRIDPMVWGIPFFFWYQFLWVLLSAAITAIVYVKAEPQHAVIRVSRSTNPRR